MNREGAEGRMLVARVITALSTLWDEKGVLLEFPKQADALVSAYIATASVRARPRDKALKRFLFKGLGSRDVEVRRVCAEGLFWALEFSVQEVALVNRHLRNSDPVVRSTLCQLIGLGGNWHDAVPQLLECVDDDDAEVRRFAAEAAGKQQMKKAIPRLVKRLLDADREVACSALLALGEIGDRSAEVIQAIRNAAVRDDIPPKLTGKILRQLTRRP